MGENAKRSSFLIFGAPAIGPEEADSARDVILSGGMGTGAEEQAVRGPLRRRHMAGARGRGEQLHGGAVSQPARPRSRARRRSGKSRELTEHAFIGPTSYVSNHMQNLGKRELPSIPVARPTGYRTNHREIQDARE